MNYRIEFIFHGRVLTAKFHYFSILSMTKICVSGVPSTLTRHFKETNVLWLLITMLSSDIGRVPIRHGVNSILELMGNSRFGIAYWKKNGIDKLWIEVCYKIFNPQINLLFKLLIQKYLIDALDNLHTFVEKKKSE